MATTISETINDTIDRLLAEIGEGHRLSLGAAGRKCGGVDPSTIWRFIHRGTKAADGSTVRLEAVKIGSKWWTTGPALSRYIRSITSQHASARLITSTGLKPGKNRKRNHAAERLAAMGC